MLLNKTNIKKLVYKLAGRRRKISSNFYPWLEMRLTAIIKDAVERTPGSKTIERF